MIKGGANLVQLRPVFSSDGKFMLICSGCSIRVLSVATGLLVTKLEGHSDQVTSIVVVPFPRNVKSLLTHAWTSSMDGTVRLWNFSSGVQIKCVNVGMPIKSMVIPELSKLSASQNSKKLGLIAFLSVYWKKGNRKSAQNDEGGRVILQNLTTGTSLMGSIAKVTYAQDLVVSPSGGLVGMADHRKLWIWRVPITPVDNVNAVKVTLLHHVKDIEVIAFDPTDTVVACGDHTGRMLVWRNVGDFTFSPNKVAIEAYRNSKKQNVIQENGSKSGVRGQDDASSCTTYHWHAHAIRSLTFTADGTHLLSGGMEAVLVIWQLDSGKREFLPRLGAPLLHIASSPDPSLFAVCCEDNSIKLVNLGSRTVEKSIQGIKPIASLSKNIEVLDYTRVAIEPQGGRVVFPTMNSTLQFYDVLHDRHVTEVQVAPRNFIFGSSISKGASEASTFVTHVTFSADGSTMATADLRLPEEDIGATSCLKFWTTDANMLHYSINTLVDEPHSAEISALVYHPEDDMAVSCSPAGDFKIWVQNKRAQGVAGWRCRSVGSYRYACPVFLHAFAVFQLYVQVSHKFYYALSLSLFGVILLPHQARKKDVLMSLKALNRNVEG
ncbi:hypothetical protein O6H91_08G042600 [Diphasiastrum complanatum]|uniref:Uncharacterized protein n=1 Tax=Diphasiastrum complanatum TaxID=34168 RepID=A0ACC2CX87_DIPCM|nr:hypothetical protein O6H91_08G042600 [Diphasiastrum complanatum]